MFQPLTLRVGDCGLLLRILHTLQCTVNVASIKVGRQGQLKHISLFKGIFIKKNELSNRIKVFWVFFYFISLHKKYWFRWFKDSGGSQFSNTHIFPLSFYDAPSTLFKIFLQGKAFFFHVLS